MLLAGGGVAYQVGSTVGAILWPAAGALLVFLGVRRWIAHRRWVRQESRRLLDPQPRSPGTTASPDPRGVPAAAADDAPLSKPPGGGIVMIIVGVVMLAIVLPHIAARIVESGSANASSGLAVGQCIAGESYVSGSDVEPEPVDCERPEATLEVVSKGDGTATCPDGKRKGSDYAALTTPSRTLCLALNAQEGRCYVRTSTLSPVACADPKANMKITKRIDGTTDDSTCHGSTVPVVYQVPPRVYCVEPR